jgi:hypothetical protein
MEWATDLAHQYEERAAIAEFDGGLSRAEAERLARRELMETIDKSGTPRSKRDVEEALQAVKERIVRGPHEGFLIHLVVVKDVLEEALRARQQRGE